MLGDGRTSAGVVEKDPGQSSIPVRQPPYLQINRSRSRQVSFMFGTVMTRSIFPAGRARSRLAGNWSLPATILIHPSSPCQSYNNPSATGLHLYNNGNLT